MNNRRGVTLTALLLLTICSVCTLIISPSFVPGILLPLGGIGLVLLLATFQNLGMVIPVFVRARTQRKQIALTFDDGPHPDFTPQALEILARFHAPACFFCLGWRVEEFPEIVKEIVSRGHEVGNHSYRHPVFLAFSSPARVRQEVLRTQQAFLACLGAPPPYYRQPLGILNPFLFKALSEEHLQLVGYSLYARDNNLDTPEAICRHVMARVQPGQVIVLHDGLANRPHHRRLSIDALPLILDALRKEGYEVVPLKTLMQDG